MTFFKGPWCKDLDSFQRSMQSMPAQCTSSCRNMSNAALEKICDPSALHIWETDSDIDNLLQLTSIIAKLCNLGVRKNKDITMGSEEGNMLIIAEEKEGRDNYSRICELVTYLTEQEGRKHLEGTVCSFRKIIVVKGWNNSIVPTETGIKDAAEKVIKRMNTAVERILDMGNFEGSRRKIVWHHGPVVRFLLHWIKTTTHTLRSTLSAITITGSLNLTGGVAPSTSGRANMLSDMTQLESYAKKLDIPVIFLDAPSQLITSEHLATYMYFYAYYIHTLLPTSLTRPHLGKAQDELIMFAFQLRGASENRYGSDVVREVQRHLDASKAKPWARMCIDQSSYEKNKCRAAGEDSAIHHAVQLADSPFALLNPNRGAPAFARLAVGPASFSASEYHTATPVVIDFEQGRLRPSNPATFYILLPAKTQDTGKVSDRIQGLMMAVIERVRQEKGTPRLGDMEKDMWKAVVKACLWAIEGCKGKMPQSIGEKVKFVQKKLKDGGWTHTLSAPTNIAAMGPAFGNTPHMVAPHRTYGFGQGYGAGQTMGMYGYAGQGQQTMMPPQAQNAIPVQYGGNGMRTNPSAYTQGTGYGHGQGQHRSGPRYAQRRQSRGEAYPQSMGGPW